MDDERLKGLLSGAGSISHTQTMERATTEYRKFQANTLSPIEHFYLDTIKSTAKEVKRLRRGKEGNKMLAGCERNKANFIESILLYLQYPFYPTMTARHS